MKRSIDDLVKLAAELSHAKLSFSFRASAKLPSRLGAKLRLSPTLFSSSEASDKASNAKLLDQPLTGLDGKLRAKLAAKLGEAVS